MRYISRMLTLAGFFALGFVAFNNFAPVDSPMNKMGHQLLKQDETDLVNEDKPEKEYVQIDGKYYEKNARGVYYINGVPTFVKTVKAKPAAAATAPKNPNLGPPIDPSILKDAMGLDANDEFFKPKTGEPE